MESTSYLKLSQVDLTGKRVLMRADFNVPLKEGVITSDARIKAALPTIEYILSQGASLLLLSHLGRPKEGLFDASYSLKPVAVRLSELLNKPVPLETDWLNGVSLSNGDVKLAENVRFNLGEKENNTELAQRMAALGDIFVMDAFGTAHRAQASTEGITHYVGQACAGFLLDHEIKALKRVLEGPQSPVAAIVGGAKVSSKLTVLKQLLSKVDVLILGGGIANTFLAAQGVNVGKSLYEPELINEARAILEQAQATKKNIPLPVDVRVSKEFSETAAARVCDINDIAADEMILDIGPKTAKILTEQLIQARSIIWNGPVGVFEFPAFSAGTQAIAQAIANSSAFSVAGGGDTVAAIEKFQVAARMSYISTGGGAFLEYLEGKALPAIVALNTQSNTKES